MDKDNIKALVAAKYILLAPRTSDLMPIYRNPYNGRSFEIGQDANLNRLIPEEEASVSCFIIGCNDNLYQRGLTYKMFINRLVKAGLLVQER